MENAPATINPAPTTLGVMQSNVSRQPVMKQMGFLLAIAASIALGGYVLMWSQSPNYQVLFSGMQAKESSEVIAVLQQSNIKYKLDPSTGAVLVPASKLQGLRLKLAAEGLPRNASPGMEMLNEDQGFGTSQFVERARYQRAMEEELSRSISELHNVRSARVHLAVPKQSVFVRDRKPPSASVVVNLYAGRNLEQGQVTAITHMIASSVPNMANNNVTIIDQKGNLLTNPERDNGIAMSDSQLQYTQKLEQGYIHRIEDILSPIVGLDGVRAQVVVEVDFTMTEKTYESYDPERAAIRSEQIQEENRISAAAGAIGIPGALSNQPPAGGVAPEVATGKDGQTSTTSLPGNSSKHSTRNFELDRTISHTRMAPGTITKLSIAVLIDERHSVDADGNVQSTPLTEIEMTRINTLVRDAVGFNETRGDSLNVVNAGFVVPPTPEELPAVPIWEQAWVWDVAKQALGGLLVLFLIFGIIRPAFKDLNKIPAGQLATADGDAAEQMAASGAGGAESGKITTGAEDVEGQLNNVRSLVQQDPALVAQVVKNWTASES